MIFATLQVKCEVNFGGNIMNEQSEEFNPILAKLPPEIVQTLKRKASRDPNSRFPKKLHMLLSYLDANPDLQDEIGLSWINDTEFRMKKKTVAEVMGIKLNTMNVNLRDLEFVQLQHDKNGWTKWKREGFTRNTVMSSFPTTTPITEKQATFVPPRISKDPSSILRLGHLSLEEESRFRAVVSNTWSMIASSMSEISSNIFIKNAANIFKTPEQPLENAIDVLKAIIAPIDKMINENDLFRFLAMFGPRNTVMVKISSILNCNKGNQSWLFFDETQIPQNCSFYGIFDQQMPNCLIMNYSNGVTRKVYNHPLIDACGTYLIDENDRIYVSWESYFQFPITF